MTTWVEQRPARFPVALAVVLWTVGMLFAAFTAALLVRRGGADWRPVPLPSILWMNTVVLAFSSAALEVARRGRAPSGRELKRWLGLAGLLGLVFVVGQLAAWVQLTAAGVFLPTNPHSSFFYMLTAVHGVHVVGGIGALVWAARRAPAKVSGWPPLKYVAAYWHFVGVVWLWLLVALSTL
ncbi:MAG: heme-copper oxidase subunit III [Gemmatimonadota bacterium]